MRRASAASNVTNLPGGGDVIPEVAYYDKSRRPNEHVCPFSASTRESPCTSHAGARKRKDAIMHHLESILAHHGDEFHPVDDPLWNEWIIKDYYLVKRPAKFSKELRDERSYQVNHRYYQRRLDEQAEKGAEMESKFEAGEITKDDYKDFLIGHKKRLFVQKLEIDEAVATRVSQIKAQGVGATDDMRQELVSLEAVQADLAQAERRAENYSGQILASMREVVGSWDRDPKNCLLNTTNTLAEHRNMMAWPLTSSVSAFFHYAAFLCPIDLYSKNPAIPSTMRKMRKNMTDYCNAQKRESASSGAGPEEIKATQRYLEDAEKVFGDSCDMMVARMEDIKVNGTLQDNDNWAQEQDDFWEGAKDLAQSVAFPLFKGKSCLQVMQFVDELAGLYRAHNGALADSAAAQRTAQRMLR
jgi:hypothetical protein